MQDPDGISLGPPVTLSIAHYNTGHMSCGGFSIPSPRMIMSRALSQVLLPVDKGLPGAFFPAGGDRNWREATLSTHPRSHKFRCKSEK